MATAKGHEPASAVSVVEATVLAPQQRKERENGRGADDGPNDLERVVPDVHRKQAGQPERSRRPGAEDRPDEAQAHGRGQSFRVTAERASGHDGGAHADEQEDEEHDGHEIAAASRGPDGSALPTLRHVVHLSMGRGRLGLFKEGLALRSWRIPLRSHGRLESLPPNWNSGDHFG